MNEVEKMFKNAKIKKQYCGWLDMGDLDCQMQYVRCNSVNEYKEAVFSSRFGETEEEPELKYPEFTAEKQLELIKWLCEKDNSVRIDFDENEWGVATENYGGYFKDNLSDALSSIINTLWQSLTEEERKHIKDILK